MILNANEFLDLRTSLLQEDYLRAATDSATAGVWLEVIRRFPEMKVWVARNKTIPKDILELLSLDCDQDVRLAVAMKNKLSRELLIQLGKDPEAAVRQRIALNKNAPIELLEELARDESECVSTPALTALARRR
jgi:hypothetical protein